VLENTLGNIWFTYGDETEAFIVSDGLFLQNKTVVFYTPYSGMNSDVTPLVLFYRQDDNTIEIETGDGISFLTLSPIEIRVYN
jgi:hypothetical protein